MVPAGQRVDVHHHGKALIRLVDRGQPVEEVTVQALTGEGQRREPVPGRDPQHDAVVIRLAPHLGRQAAADRGDDLIRRHRHSPARSTSARPASRASGRGGQPGT